jgi:O-antigen/teichoic acid export membrane protein
MPEAMNVEAGRAATMAYGGDVRPKPRAVDVGAILVALVGAVSVARVGFGVLNNLRQDGWDSGARAVFLVLNSIVLLFALFLLLLAYQVGRGRMWAWITSLVMLPFTILFGSLLLLITALNGAIPWAGTAVVAAAVAAIVTLIVARNHFLRPPAPPAYPVYPPQQLYPPR